MSWCGFILASVRGPHEHVVVTVHYCLFTPWVWQRGFEVWTKSIFDVGGIPCFASLKVQLKISFCRGWLVQLLTLITRAGRAASNDINHRKARTDSAKLGNSRGAGERKGLLDPYVRVLWAVIAASISVTLSEPRSLLNGWYEPISRLEDCLEDPLGPTSPWILA